uniref:adipose-secreted signaling protein n=1 Tax=Doryrhamphus excisus TaxID=161450 RepID=UPI0025AE7BCD|nr:adipose-secreted signaling protein [Doryrhamphus excisus]
MQTTAGTMAAAKKSCAKTAGGVRFSEKTPEAGAPSHVHFDDKLHDSVVMVTSEDDGSFLVKVGFLKTQHRYEITFTLPEVPALGKDVCPAPLASPHLRINDISPAPEGGVKVTCEYLAQQEGVLYEEVQLLSEDNQDVCVKVKVHARVMDRHHGTPMLLEGVRCIGVELEYDSEQSDWQGFD